MLCRGQTWPLNCAIWRRPQAVPPIRPTREHLCGCRSPVGGAAQRHTYGVRPAVARSRRGILEPWLRAKVLLYIRHAPDRKCVVWVQRHEAILLVKNLRVVQVRRDRPRAGKVRLVANAEHRAARVPCIALGGVDARDTRADQFRLVLCVAQSRKNVACVIPIRGAIRSS